MAQEITIAIISMLGTVAVALIGQFATLLKFRADNKKQLQEQIDIQHTENGAIKAGLQAVLRSQLLVEYDRAMVEGWLSHEKKQMWEQAYQIYHALGANGIMDSYRATLMALPSKKI